MLEIAFTDLFLFRVRTCDRDALHNLANSTALVVLELFDVFFMRVLLSVLLMAIPLGVVGSGVMEGGTIGLMGFWEEVLLDIVVVVFHFVCFFFGLFLFSLLLNNFLIDNIMRGAFPNVIPQQSIILINLVPHLFAMLFSRVIHFFLSLLIFSFMLF